MNMVEIAAQLEVACHSIGADFTIPGRDNSLRGLGIDNHQDYPYRVELQGLPSESSDDGENLQTHVRTPQARSFCTSTAPSRWRVTASRCPLSIIMRFAPAADLEAVAQIFEHLVVIPTPDSYRAFHQRVGDRGIAPWRGPVGRPRPCISFCTS